MQTTGKWIGDGEKLLLGLLALYKIDTDGKPWKTLKKNISKGRNVMDCCVYTLQSIKNKKENPFKVAYLKSVT